MKQMQFEVLFANVHKIRGMIQNNVDFCRSFDTYNSNVHKIT